MDKIDYYALESSMNIGLDIAEEGLFSKVKEKLDARSDKKAAKHEDLMLDLERDINNSIIYTYNGILEKHMRRTPEMGPLFDLKIHGVKAGMLTFSPFTTSEEVLNRFGKDLKKLRLEFYLELGKTFVANVHTSHMSKRIGIRMMDNNVIGIYIK